MAESPENSFDTRVDVVVVGAGLMGAAAAWSLARAGREVVLVDQFAPGHANGSSHGSARIVRRAYGDPDYSRWAGQAFELWRELEHVAGRQLVHWYGGLDFGAARQVDALARHFADTGVEHEVLPAGEAEARWPGMRFAGPVVFTAQAGVLDAAQAVETFVSLAAAHGAEVRRPWPVARIEIGDGAVVHGEDGARISAPLVVVAAGAWVGDLLAGLVSLPPLRVSEESVFHFPRRDPSAAPWPSTIHEDAIAAYHLAGGRDGGPGGDRKVGIHASGRPTTARGRSGEPDPASRQRLVDYVRTWLPGLEPVPRGETTCLYTSTPNEEFVLDRVGPLVVCSPCSGHGAKFAPLVGEWVTALLERPDSVPARFRLAAHAEGRVGAVSL